MSIMSGAMHWQGMLGGPRRSAYSEYLGNVDTAASGLAQAVVMETAFDDTYSFEEFPKSTFTRIYVHKLSRCMSSNYCGDVKSRHSLEDAGVFSDKVEFLTVTINPDDDTHEALKHYANQFEVESANGGWIFFRGSEEDTKKLADSLDFLYRDPGTGDIIHSSFAYFLDKVNNLLEQFTMGEGFDRDKAYKRIMSTIN